MQTGPRNLITDIEGILVGNAEDHGAKTGVTVLTAERPFTAGVSIMGGAPGTRETDLLAPDKMVQEVDALVLSGGSTFGLDAASGVSDGVVAAGRGYTVGPVRVPIIPAAILFDLINGGDKAWGTPPYRDLGRAAFDLASDEFRLGTHGAGVGGATAGLKGGLGSASLVTPSGAMVGALVAVNSLGAAVAPEGPRFWAGPWEIGDEFGGLGAPQGPFDLAATFTSKADALAKRANTTIAIVATDIKLDKAGATRLATAAQDGMARALAPAHTLMDGDLVFGVSTGARVSADPMRDAYQTGHAAAICLSRAIARGVYEAKAAPGDRFPTWNAEFGAGR